MFLMVDGAPSNTKFTLQIREMNLTPTPIHALGTDIALKMAFVIYKFKC